MEKDANYNNVMSNIPIKSPQFCQKLYILNSTRTKSLVKASLVIKQVGAMLCYKYNKN